MCLSLYAQKDSIQLTAQLSDDGSKLLVKQKIIYHNLLQNEISQIKLLNWISAYKNRKTPLLRRKIEDHKNSMYFADAKDLGALENLKIKIGKSSFEHQNTQRENLYIPLQSPLKTGEKIELSLDYELILPLDIYTGYGRGKDVINLKYFFIVPDGHESETQKERHYLDLEEVQNAPSFWDINLVLPANFSSSSNLKEVKKNQYSGSLKTDPEIVLSKNVLPALQFELNGKNVQLDLGYHITDEERANLEFLVPLQLNFIATKLGAIPEKIFITKKLKDEEDFFGNNDIHFWKFRYQLFSNAENTDMDYIGILAKNILNHTYTYNKETDHWLINGLKTYIEKTYLQKFYGDDYLLGNLANEVKFLGIKPLKWFYASELKLKDRYGLGYQYAASENVDQKLNLQYSQLSNLNKTIISNFEAGSLLDFIADKMKPVQFDQFLKQYISATSENQLDTKDFLDQLSLASGYSSVFLETFITEKQRANFNLKSYKKYDDHFSVKIKKNTALQIPFKIETETEDSKSETYWFDTSISQKSTTYTIPSTDVQKILINNHYSFPESNYRDNYLYTKGLFSNTKKLKIKIFKDIPNPEYNEIYLNPKLNFNAYDKLLLGINFKNSSLFKRKFEFSITPYYSTGAKEVTGSSALSYTIMPANSFFRSLNFGMSASYFHYDHQLSYSRFGIGSNINFSKNPRSDISRSLSFSYNHYEKDLTPLMQQNKEYSKYNLWSLSFNYNNARLIHENNFGTGLQVMEDFAKIYTSGYYRYEYAKDKKVSFRAFAGYFITNNTRNNLFDFGISKVSNYAFSYGLLGQSDTSGFFAQQMVIAEGAFKSYVATSANQWIGTFNTDAQIWKWFHLYADAGVYKNKNQSSQFIWDSGVKLAILPDFLEFYFPVQSSLGFEPGFKDYASRIRFTFNFNLGALTANLRKGVF